MSTPQFLFGRAWNVTVGFPGGAALSYTSLRTTFDIKKNSANTTDKAKVELFNLSQASRERFQKKGLEIIVQAGYQDLIKTIMIADVTRMVTKRHGAEIITEFECGVGEKAVSELFFNKSYPPGTELVQIISDILFLFQDNGISIGPVRGIPSKKFNSSRSFNAGAKSTLDVLLRNSNLEVQINNNTIQILPRNADKGEPVIVLSKASGLIGVPSQKDMGIQFEALLNPDIAPGSAVQLICGEVAGQLDIFNAKQSSISGFYRIRTAHYIGDSHGEKWFVKCEADPLPNGQSQLPFNKGTNLNTAVVGG